MPNPKKLIAILIPLFLLIFSLFPPPSSARQLRPAGVNLALPGDNISGKDSGYLTLGRTSGRKWYGPIILNLLPKGTAPPSAPSRGTNDLQN